MQFYNTTNTENSLVHAAWDFCDADINSYPLADVTRNMNLCLEELVGDILNADGRWEWDDTNQTNLPRGTGTLVEGQESYSFASEYLKIQMIEILRDSSPDQYTKLKPISSLDLGGLSPQEYFGQESNGDPKKGVPEYYDKLGDTIFLYPAPAAASGVTLAAGLRVWFQRTADLFTTSDTTQEPGLPSPYHVLLPYYAAIVFCNSYKKDRVAWLEKKYDQGLKKMLTFFGKREEDDQGIISGFKINYR